MGHVSRRAGVHSIFPCMNRGRSDAATGRCERRHCFDPPSPGLGSEEAVVWLFGAPAFIAVMVNVNRSVS